MSKTEINKKTPIDKKYTDEIKKYIDQTRNIYQTPLSGRYASDEMKYIFSDNKKFSTWRKLWIALAEAEKQLGKTEITDEMISEMKEHIYDINYETIATYEKQVRHDVMANVKAYGDLCPKAKGIIHWGATSCYVTDNTDILNLRDALFIIRKRLLGVIKLLADSANKHKDIPTLGYTHYQAASPVTVGKREALWLQNFVNNLGLLDYVISTLKMLGCRGATGTSATFMDIFEDDEEKVKRLDEIIASKFGFKKVYSISGQTYPRNLDVDVAACLSAISVSSIKMAKDIRMLQHDKEIEEPFEKDQIGSSAMAYKRNPMRSERIVALGRHVNTLIHDPIDTASDQWFERTLDDSANRRISLPELFLACEGMLIIVGNVIDGMVINNKIIEKRLAEELPFMATENIIMEAVKKGGDRQVLHEHIRIHSIEAGKRIKRDGLNNDLLERIASDPIFGMTMDEIKTICNAKKLTGRSSNQVTDYLENEVFPLLKENSEWVKEIETTVSV